MGRTVVLIVNWNGKRITLDCVRSLVESGVCEEDVLVVDNGSTDGSVEALRAAHPRARHILLPTNLGFAGGCDRGLEALLAEHDVENVLLLNNDTLATPGLVARLEEALASHPRAAMAQPKLAFFDKKTIENAGYEMDRFGVTWPRGRGEDVATSYPPTGFFYTSGACVLVRLAALREVGLFDESYGSYHEDVDLNWRLRLAGWSLLYVDDALCYHDESTTAGRADAKIGRIWRNRFRTILKNYGTARVLWTLPAAVALTGIVAVGTAVLQRRAVFLGLYVKAVGSFVRHFHATLRERRRVQRLRRVKDRDVLTHQARGSIEARMLRARLGKRR